MKKLFAVFALSFLPSFAFADDAIITPTPAYAGYIECSKFLSSGDYLVHTEGKGPDSDYSSKKTALNVCAPGGSECQCYVPFTAEKAFSEKEHSYEVLTPKKEKLWVTIPVPLNQTTVTLPTYTGKK